MGVSRIDKGERTGGVKRGCISRLKGDCCIYT